MENKMTPLPIGISFFDTIIEKGYYYVDKTLLIKELLDKGAAVNLFTRPRRFGKTLNMRMIQCFFEDMSKDCAYAGIKSDKLQKRLHDKTGRVKDIKLSRDKQ
jgi:hypothetical protein